MKNEEIIEQIARHIYGNEAVDQMISRGDDIPVHTLKYWKSKGYKVRKNEHGIECKLWRKRRVEESDGEFYLTKSFVFTENQVEIDEKGA